MPDSPRPNLEPLQSAYDIVAELGDHGNETAYLARRRDDGRDVLIRVERTPPGDERNALTLLAADVKTLAALRHRHVVPIVEGTWLGTDAFAVVSERVTWPTLREWIARGEKPGNARVALVLQQVSDVLAWAREQKIVHRAADADGVYVDPGSDSVEVSFVVRPMPLTGAPGEEGDARTVAALAMAMLTGDPEAVDRPAEALAERRPDLPKRVVDETADLLEPGRRGDARLDVRSYIALVAMADALKEAEDGARRTEQELDGERQAFAEEMARERAALAADRQAFADDMVRQRAALIEVPEPLARETQPAGAGGSRFDRELVTVFGGAAALVVLVLAAAFGIAHRRPAAAAPTQATVRPAAVDSSAGAVAATTPVVVPLDRRTTRDSVTRKATDTTAAAPSASAAADSAAARAARARRARHSRMLDSIRALQDSALMALPGDSVSGRVDTLVRHDTLRKPKRDTTPKPDTTPTVKPDTGS